MVLEFWKTPIADLEQKLPRNEGMGRVEYWFKVPDIRFSGDKF